MHELGDERREARENKVTRAQQECYAYEVMYSIMHKSGAMESMATKSTCIRAQTSKPK